MSVRNWRMQGFRAASIGALLAVALLGSGCEEGVKYAAGSRSGFEQGPSTRDGVLAVTVRDEEGEPWVGANVSVSAENPSWSDSLQTDARGTVTLRGVPPRVRVGVSDEGARAETRDMAVAQSGITELAVTLSYSRNQPTVALLPVHVLPEQVSADRTELTLEVQLVAAKDAPFLSGYGLSVPGLSLQLGEWDEYGSGRQCWVHANEENGALGCGEPWRPGVYTVTLEEFHHDPKATQSIPGWGTPFGSALLLLEQSHRVALRDPDGRRMFAARRASERLLGAGAVAVAGFAGPGGDQAPPALLPVLPLWSPLGEASAYSVDSPALAAATTTLLPMSGGAAPVLSAWQAAMELVASYAPAGGRVLIGALGGDDDSGISGVERQLALDALRARRQQADIRSIVISGASYEQIADRRATAALAAALEAPLVALGFGSDWFNPWPSGIFGALDLAADLALGVPLPTLSARFRVRSAEPGAFRSGDTLYGAVLVDSITCPMTCWEIPLEFAVAIP